MTEETMAKMARAHGQDFEDMTRKLFPSEAVEQMESYLVFLREEFEIRIDVLKGS